MTGTFDGRWTAVLWRDGELVAAPDIAAVVELAADIDDLDLTRPRDAATAIMLALDHVEHLEVHPTQTV